MVSRARSEGRRVRKGAGGFCTGGGRRAAAAALACSGRNWPPWLPSLTHIGPQGSRDPKALSAAPRRSGSTHPRLAAAAQAATPLLGAAAWRRLSPLHSAPRVPEEAPPHPGSVTCASSGPASLAFSSSRRAPGTGRTERRHLARVRRRPF